MENYICKKCSNTTFQRLTYTQVKCLHCDDIHDMSPEHKLPVTPPKTITPIYNISVPEKSNYITASLTKRFANHFIDGIAIIFLMIILSFFTGFFSIIIFFFFPVFLFFFSPLYYAVMEYKFGKTIGKYATKTKVISTNGKPLDFWQCLLRTICRIIPFEPISGLAFKGIFWHDSIARTMVIEDI